MITLLIKSDVGYPTNSMEIFRRGGGTLIIFRFNCDSASEITLDKSGILSLIKAIQYLYDQMPEVQ